MKVTGLVRTITGVVTATAIMSAIVPEAHAQQTTGSPLFPGAEAFLSKSRMTMRLGYTYAFIKTKSGDAYDVTGPVATRAELEKAFEDGVAITAAHPCSLDTSTPDDLTDRFCVSGDNRLSTLDGSYQAARNALTLPDPDGAGPRVGGYMVRNNIDGLGAPPGIKAKSGNGGTPTLSIGYWLDADYKWFVEAMVLGAPITIHAFGDGINPSGKKNGINGKGILSTKLLPPLAIFSRYFGGKDSVVRPYLGLGAMYAIFFDSKTTSVLDTYQGGKTSVSLKNAFGVGPFAGLQGDLSENWHINFSIGHVKLKTQATLVTYDTRIRTGDAILNDFENGPNGRSGVTNAIVNIGENNWSGQSDVGMTTAIMELVAGRRNCGGLGASSEQVNSCSNRSLGNFVRKQNQEFANTIITVSVGRSF